MKKENFPALTGIRFVAATLVFFCHYPALLVSKEGFPFLFFFFRQLNIGVNLFFVLSGFLITYRYYDRSVGGKGFQLYLIKRFIRIFPLYLLLLFVFFLSRYRQGHEIEAFDLFLNVTLLKGLSNKYIFSGVAQSWSLTVEEMFYAFAPLSFVLIRRKKIFFLQVPFLVVVGLLLVLLFKVYSWEGFFGSYEFMLSATFFGRCFEFFTGMYLALLWLKKEDGPVRYRYFTLTGSLLFLCLMLCQGYYAYSINLEAANKTPLGILLFNLAIPVSIGVLYQGLLHEKTWLRRMLASSPVVLLGKSSYAFYLLHLGYVAEVVYFHLSSNWLLLFIILQLFSILLYKVFEKPVYFYLLHKLAPGRKTVLQTKATVEVPL